MNRAAACILWGIAVLGLTVAQAAGAEITAERSEKGVVVKIDGELFAEYLTDVNGTPAIWPIIGPGGAPMTRAYPMGEQPGERTDHPHHRSLWFNHGDVNQLSFWHRDTIRHREFVKVESGSPAIIVTRNDWIKADGARVCEDERTIAFGTDGKRRYIDFDITLRAGGEPVKFGDTKEGTFGVRVAETMKVDAKLGGRIINSEGDADGAAWAKRAAWVDYHGPVGDQRVGVAILNHPSSFRYPTYWHVRTYGLFAANPFGVRDFTGDKNADGSHTLAPGESITLRYRVLLHLGDEKEGGVADAFKAYAAQEK